MSQQDPPGGHPPQGPPDPQQPYPQSPQPPYPPGPQPPYPQGPQPFQPPPGPPPPYPPGSQALAQYGQQPQNLSTYGQQPAGGPLAEPPKISLMSWVSLALAIPAFLVGWVPFAGLAGLLGVGVAVAEIVRKDGPPRPRGISILSIVLGSLSTLAGICWVVLALTVKISSCPHVYTYDGERWALDADPLSGALLPGAERSDWDRLEHLTAADGVYRLRVLDELEEIDRIDEVALLVVDHAPGAAALPTPEGAIIEVREAIAPLRATDRQGRDALPRLLATDGEVFTGTMADTAPGEEPHERLTLTFPRPTGSEAALVLRAHNTPFAEEAFARYAARLGPATGTLMHLAEDASWYPYRTRITDEIRLLGLPLGVGVTGGSRVEIAPIGPAIQRDFAVLIAIPPGIDPTVSVVLDLTPRFWEIDRVALSSPPTRLEPQRLRPRRAVGSAGADLTEALSAADQRRVELHTGEGVELSFDAPAATAGRERSVILEIRGSYEMPFGGRGWLNPPALLAHRRGWDSLPRFAARLDRERAGTSR